MCLAKAFLKVELQSMFHAHGITQCTLKEMVILYLHDQLGGYIYESTIQQIKKTLDIPSNMTKLAWSILISYMGNI